MVFPYELLRRRGAQQTRYSGTKAWYFSSTSWTPTFWICFCTRVVCAFPGKSSWLSFVAHGCLAQLSGAGAVQRHECEKSASYIVSQLISTVWGQCLRFEFYGYFLSNPEYSSKLPITFLIQPAVKIFGSIFSVLRLWISISEAQHAQTSTNCGYERDWSGWGVCCLPQQVKNTSQEYGGFWTKGKD